jgi:hypothetical protein
VIFVVTHISAQFGKKFNYHLRHDEFQIIHDIFFWTLDSQDFNKNDFYFTGNEDYTEDTLKLVTLLIAK